MSGESSIAGFTVLGFVLGFVVSTLLLVMVPVLHRKLTLCSRTLLGKCTSSREDVTRRDQISEKIEETTEARRVNHYSEIDEKKTRTFAPTHARTPLETRACGKQHYEDCLPGDKTHGYSNLDVDVSKNTSGTTNNSESYKECVPAQNKRSKEENRESNHTYFILEPGSHKRLPVKAVENSAEMVPCDPNHVYFILEPGTNKVKLVPQNITGNYDKGESERTFDRDSGHTYFILEPMTESADDSETMPYAVNDVVTGHNYFILEKI